MWRSHRWSAAEPASEAPPTASLNSVPTPRPSPRKANWSGEGDDSGQRRHPRKPAEAATSRVSAPWDPGLGEQPGLCWLPRGHPEAAASTPSHQQAVSLSRQGSLSGTQLLESGEAATPREGGACRVLAQEGDPEGLWAPLPTPLSPPRPVGEAAQRNRPQPGGASHKEGLGPAGWRWCR